VSATLPNSKDSNSASTSATTAASRLRIQRSAVVIRSAGGSGPATVAPRISANRPAFHSLVTKLRLPCTHSSDSGWSVPGLAPFASVKRRASAP
jgi:hypothetical protein